MVDNPQNQNSHVSFDAMFEHASLGILICNLEGVIERVNPHANKIFGYQDNELIGQKIEILIPQKIRTKHVEHRVHYNKVPTSRAMGIGMDLHALKKDGTEFPVEISLAHYEMDGKRQIVSFVSDITVRKKTEEELKKLNTTLESKVFERTQALSQAIMELQHTNENLQSEMEQRKKIEEEVRLAFEKEKELSELKSRFVSMASHEFRTPLAGILSSVSLIARYNNPSDEQKRNKHIQTIKISVQNLTNILNDFLSLDKLEQGKIQCHPTSFLLSDFAKELVDEMHVITSQKERICYEHQGDERLVKLDKEMFKNILINLSSNAMKYSAPEKKVHLTTELKNQTLIVTIQDKGVGIPEEDQKHLFETFFRAHNVTTISGTGLGLNIVKRYLDLMGGKIEFVSQENVGTTFKVTVPIS